MCWRYFLILWFASFLNKFFPILNVEKVQFSFMVCAFFIFYLQKFYFFMIYSRNFIVSSFIFRPVVHFKLTFFVCCEVMFDPFFSYKYPILCTICSKSILSLFDGFDITVVTQLPSKSVLILGPFIFHSSIHLLFYAIDSCSLY